MIEWLHPGLLLIGGAILVPFFRGAGRRAYLVALAAGALLDILAMSPGEYGVVRFLDQRLVLGRVDQLSLVFAWVFGLITLVGIIYALHVERAGEHVAALVYAGSSLGAVLAGDLLTLFVFWETMAFSSVFLVWYRGEKESLAAGFRYLLVHVAGGASLLAGIVLQQMRSGSLAFGSLTAEAGSAAFWLILAGFALNAAVPPLSAWLTDAYPEATVTGAVFLSAFTTKTGVYALARGFAGTELLMWAGAGMALLGIIYAMLQDDPRRLLAYHIISQVGYMVCGIGLGTALGTDGASAHAFANILHKGLLFMGAGAVMQMTGRRKLSEMGGLYRTMPLTFLFYMVGAFSISALPLTSGFVSKSMVVAASGEVGQTLVFLMLTAASAGTFLSVGLKLPWYMFLGRDSGLPAREPPRNMLMGMGLASFLCVFVGVFPGSLYGLLPFGGRFSPYTAQHLVSTMEVLLFTGLAFILLLRKLAPKPSLALDTDWFYRRGAALLMRLVKGPLARWEFGPVDSAHARLVDGTVRAAPWFQVLDNRVVEGAVTGVARVSMAGGDALRALQNGRYHRYALVMALGVVAMLAFVLMGDWGP